MVLLNDAAEWLKCTVRIQSVGSSKELSHRGLGLVFIFLKCEEVDCGSWHGNDDAELRV